MNKLFLGMVIGGLIVFAYQRGHQPGRETGVTEEFVAAPAVEAAASAQGEESRYHCDGRVYCSQMTSCEEATWFLQNCPGVKMDNDGHGDGIPCERQWCKND